MANADRILVIDDDDSVCGIVSAVAKTMGFDCVATKDPASFQKHITPSTTLILLDLMMPGMDGIEVLRLLGERHVQARILLMSGMNKRVLETAEKLAQSLGLQVIGHLHKPVPLQALRNTLEAVAKMGPPMPQVEVPALALPDEQLLEAFERDEFVNHYQPQVSLSTGEVTGFEALARWRHPELGLLPPDCFIARIEALGMIDRLCMRTAELALTDLKGFGMIGGAIPRISLNASTNSLHNLEFPDRFEALAQSQGIPANKIAIEVTESGLIRQLSRTLDVLTRLRMKGFHLSIDDFGTGYAMMQQLQNVPATELKIDKSLVDLMHENDSERVMVEKVIEIGHGLDMEVVAEGVTVKEQFDLLRKMGCDGAQGYLISPAMPAERVPGWLAEFGQHKPRRKH